MRYLKVEKLTKPDIGKFIHIDFYNRSFSPFSIIPRKLDKIRIKLNDNYVHFKEHRVDDGFNNWFNQQYLEASKKVDGYQLRLLKHKLIEIKKGTLVVKSYFDFFDGKGKRILNKSFRRLLVFRKDQIVEVLIKADELPTLAIGDGS